MGLQIKKAVRYKAKARVALYGPSGSGKTYTALAMARAMAGDGRVLVIDTERGSASKYADAFPGFEFDVIELQSFHPHTYVEAIKMAVSAKEYSVLIIDSATHEWTGSKGALETAGRDFRNWAKVTPLHNAFIDAMLDCPLHVIATMRAKEKFEMMEVIGDDGKKKSEVQKIGMEAIQGKDIQYEFDIVGSLDIDNTLTIQKTRCSDLKGGVFPMSGKNVADIIIPWLDGLPAPVVETPKQEEAPAKQPESPLSACYNRAKVLGAFPWKADAGKENVDAFLKWAEEKLERTIEKQKDLTLSDLDSLNDIMNTMKPKPVVQAAS